MPSFTPPRRSVEIRGCVRSPSVAMSMAGSLGLYDSFFFFQAEDGIRDADVTGVQTCALPILTGVALITFILLAVKNPVVQVQLLVWIFVMRIIMLVASTAAYFLNGAIAKAKYGNVDDMNFEEIGRASCRERGVGRGGRRVIKR